MAGKGRIGRSPRMLLGGTNGRAGKDDLGEDSGGCQGTAVCPRCNKLLVLRALGSIEERQRAHQQMEFGNFHQVRGIRPDLI